MATNTTTTMSQTKVERSGWEVLCNAISLELQEDVSESVGRSIGARLVTRMNPALPPYSSTLDTFKFFCKDVWMELYDKKVDRLQTNHRGVFMFTDLAFPPMFKLKSNQLQFLAIHKGIVAGALMNLGLEVVNIALEILPPTSKPGSIEQVCGACFTVTLNKY